MLVCPDCKGSGQYLGLGHYAIQACRRCNGTGEWDDAPPVPERRAGTGITTTACKQPPPPPSVMEEDGQYRREHAALGMGDPARKERQPFSLIAGASLTPGDSGDVVVDPSTANLRALWVDSLLVTAAFDDDGQDAGALVVMEMVCYQGCNYLVGSMPVAAVPVGGLAVERDRIMLQPGAQSVVVTCRSLHASRGIRVWASAAGMGFRW